MKKLLSITFTSILITLSILTFTISAQAAEPTQTTYNYYAIQQNNNNDTVTIYIKVNEQWEEYKIQSNNILEDKYSCVLVTTDKQLTQDNYKTISILNVEPVIINNSNQEVICNTIMDFTQYINNKVDNTQHNFKIMSVEPDYNIIC